MIISVLSVKNIVLVVHITLVKSNVMQKLDGMTIIIQLKIQNLLNCHFQSSNANNTGKNLDVSLPIEPCRRYLCQVKKYNASTSITFMKKALFIDMIPKFAIV